MYFLLKQTNNNKKLVITNYTIPWAIKHLQKLGTDLFGGGFCNSSLK